MTAMIETEGLTRSYGRATALRHLDLRIAEGEVFGFIGPNGAGKTTTIRILATLLSPTRGRARIAGVDLVARPRAARSLLGYMPDHIGIYDDMQAGEYLHFFAASYGIRGAARADVVERVLALTDLGGKRESQIRALSRGMTQRLSLARVLLHDPLVLLLDEPAAGLDPRARTEFKELVAELRRLGKTIFLSSHILSEVEEMCTTIGIIEAGRLLYHGPIAGVREKLAAETGRILRIRALPPPGAAPDALADLARAHPLAAGLRSDGGDLLVRLRPDAADPSPIAADLVAAGFRLLHFSEERMDLEEVFLRVTKGEVA
ncbi:MAG: ABC transporter ATP-binding protein [Planctomycetes bacterium]|jgi:ABC-2 type transport system ATP-binding protein|nr:ABC transporter ATP-binding protein [Planctomycetota bacterium]